MSPRCLPPFGGHHTPVVSTRSPLGLPAPQLCVLLGLGFLCPSRHIGDPHRPPWTFSPLHVPGNLTPSQDACSPITSAPATSLRAGGTAGRSVTHTRKLQATTLVPSVVRHGASQGRPPNLPHTGPPLHTATCYATSISNWFLCLTGAGPAQARPLSQRLVSTSYMLQAHRVGRHVTPMTTSGAG